MTSGRPSDAHKAAQTDGSERRRAEVCRGSVVFGCDRVFLAEWAFPGGVSADGVGVGGPAGLVFEGVVVAAAGVQVDPVGAAPVGPAGVVTLVVVELAMLGGPVA